MEQDSGDVGTEWVFSITARWCLREDMWINSSAKNWVHWVRKISVGVPLSAFFIKNYTVCTNLESIYSRLSLIYKHRLHPNKFFGYCWLYRSVSVYRCSKMTPFHLFLHAAVHDVALLKFFSQNLLRFYKETSRTPSIKSIKKFFVNTF